MRFSGITRESTTIPGDYKPVPHIRTNKQVICFLFVFIFSLSLYANAQYLVRSRYRVQALFPPFQQGVVKIFNEHLGGEYLFIAQAIVDGKGFSNPFQVETGPTAWMPPLYPYILAGIIALLKSKVLIVCFVVLVKNIVLVAAGLLIYETAKKTRTALRAEVAVALYCLYLLTFFKWFFQLTHDEWLLMLLVCLLYPWAVHIRNSRIRFAQSCAWGGFGGVCMLASPILGAVWGAMAVATMARRNFKYLLPSLAVCAAVCLPWMVRNYIVFDRIILMKSNMYFDLYTANYETEKGLFTEITFVRQHPLWTITSDPNAPYKVLGEMKFMDMYKDIFQQAFAADPGKYFNAVINRFVGAFILYPPYCEHEPSVIEGPTAPKLILHFLPFVGIVLILFAGKRQAAVYTLTAAGIFVLYLLPYVLVNYYNRYGIPLTPLKVLCVFWGLDIVAARLPVGFKRYN